MTAWGRTVLAQRTDEKVRTLQETLHRAAKADSKRTFGVLYDKVTRWEVLWLAWYQVRRNRGAPGVDGRTIEAIKASGEVRFLREIQADYGATFVVKNIEDYKVYMHSPIHRKVDEIGLPLVENMVSYDITDDEDPTIAEQIATIHKERFAGDKPLADLIRGLESYSGSSKPE